MRKLISLFFGISLLIACNQKSETSDDGKNLHAESGPVQEESRPVIQDSSVTFKIIPAESGATGFGYDIYMNGKLYVHQPTIPAVEGNRAFSTEQKAAQAAQLVIYKIQHNILPPTVEVRELDSLHLLD